MEARNPIAQSISTYCLPVFKEYELLSSSPERPKPKPKPKISPNRKCGQPDTKFPSQVTYNEANYKKRVEGDAAGVSVDGCTGLVEGNNLNWPFFRHPYVDQLESLGSLEDSKELPEEVANSVKATSSAKVKFLSLGFHEEIKAPPRRLVVVVRRPFGSYCFSLALPADGVKRHVEDVHTQTEKGGKKWVCQVPTCPMISKIWTKQDTFRQHVIRMHGAQSQYLAKDMGTQFDSDISAVPLGNSETRFQRGSTLNQYMAYKGDYGDQSQWKAARATSAAPSFFECLNSRSSSLGHCPFCEIGTCIKCTKYGSVGSQPNARREDIIECATKLLAAFANAEHELSAFSCAISCVLNSARALHKTELQEAVRIHDLKHLSPKFEFDTEFSGTIYRMLTSVDSIFTEDDAGFVHFKNKTMGTFLHNFRIDGVDASHKTLAKICLAALHNQPDNDINPSWNSRKKLALASYARDYCHHHCRAAANSKLGARPRYYSAKDARLYG